MGSRFVVLVMAVGVLAAPAAAGAATKTVTMGPTPKQGKVLQQQLASDANQFFPGNVTIHAGDTVRFLPFGFHNANFPKRGSEPLSLFIPGAARWPWTRREPPSGSTASPSGSIRRCSSRTSERRLRYTGAKAVNSGCRWRTSRSPSW